MTGSEHYREAEKLTTLAAQSSRERPDWAAEYLAAAQVHATLALAAAVAESGGLANVGTLGVLSPWGRALDGS